MNLTEEQKVILTALRDTPAGMTIRALNAATGLRLKTADLRTMAAVDLVREVPLTEAPFTAYVAMEKGLADVPPAPAAEPTAPTVEAQGPIARGRNAAKLGDDDKARLRSSFAEGKADDAAGIKRLAGEFDVDPATIRYHLRVWDKDGRPSFAPSSEGDLPLTDPPAPESDELKRLRADAKMYEQFGIIVPLSPSAEVESDDQQGEPAAVAPAEQPLAEPVIELTGVQPGKVEADGEPGALPYSPIEVEQEQPAPPKPESVPEPAPSAPVTAMAAALLKAGVAQKVEPAAPEVGSVYEGVVSSLDYAGGFALVELVGFIDPGTGKPARGRVNRRDVLRRGHCADVRDWLREGDLCNVKVTSCVPGTGKRRWYMNLSIAAAPAHERERIPLEAVASAPAAVQHEPITTRGAQVVAQMAAGAMPAESDLPSPTARPLIEKAHVFMAREDLGEAENERIASQVTPSLLDQLTAAEQEVERLRASLAAHSAWADRMIGGLCAICVHRLDGFCPYPDAVAETYELPAEDLHQRHQGRRIVFGRRAVTECELCREVRVV